jgi:phosphoglycerate dehydrogenase-like enzyme
VTGLRIAFLDDVHQAYEQSEGVARLRELAAVEAVHVFERHVDDPAELAGFDILVTTRERTDFPREVLQRLGRVRLIVQTGSKAYHIDLAAAAECGIKVAKAEGSSARSTAELAMGLLLALTRSIPHVNASIRAGDWPVVMGRSLAGMRLGLVGYGTVAQEVVPLAKAFGMSVVAWSPSLLAGSRPAGDVRVASLEALATSSDVLSVHTALTAETRGLIDERLLNLLPRGSYLLNTSRGAVVDEQALLDALTRGQLAGAGLDVFDDEPLPATHPLRHCRSAVLTPHIGWVTDSSYGAFAAKAADLVQRYLENADLPSFE